MSSLYYSFLIRWPNRFTVSSRSWVVPITKGYIALIRRSGKESNPTQLMVIVVKYSSLWVVQLPSQNNLSNDIQTHGASTISDPVMPVRNERFATPFSFSDLILPYFVSTAWRTLATHLPSLCLGGLFPPSDLWYSSSSLSHRPSTSLLYVLQLSLSRTTPHRYSVGD